MVGGVTAKANPPTQGSKYRIRVGQTIAGIVWSNTAFTVVGRWTIIYDDGEPDYWPIAEVASGSSRAAVTWTTGQIAKKNGWIVGGNVGAGTGNPTQRGQAFTQAFVVDQDIVIGKVSDILAAGYVYAGHTASLGVIGEPGPAGGHGALTTIGFADPAAGAEIAGSGPPTGALWRWHTGTVQLVQGITQTPLPTLFIKRSGTLIAQLPAMNAALAASSTSQLTWAKGAVLFAFTSVVGDEIYTAPFPDMILDSNDTIGTITDGIGANTNYGVLTVQVEEWVMPN
jgi:hypothetical protein